MAYTISAALAVAFSYTTETVKIKLSSGTEYTATTTTGTRAVGLTTSAADLARLLAANLTTAVAAAPGPPTFAATWGTDGKIAITCTGDTWKSDAGSLLSGTTAGRILGYAAGDLTGYTATHTASLQPMYVAYLTSTSRNFLRSMRAGGYEVTHGGRVYGFQASATRHVRTLHFAMVPRTPTIATSEGTPATPLYPDDTATDYRASLGSTATLRAWAWHDILKVAPNAACTWTGDFQAMRTSTSALYDVGYLGAKELLALEDTRLDETWDCYHELDLTLSIPTSGGTGTRA